MSLLRALARVVSGTMGRESAAIRALRPAYNWLLLLASGGRGVWWRVNGRERYRIDPFMRRSFPAEYDPAVHAFLRSRVKPGSVILDVGAHMGVYALCLAGWTGPGGKVFAFEPNPLTRGVLAHHVSMNGFTSRIEIREEAVSDEPGQATFIATGREGTSKLGKRNPDVPDGTPILVPVTTVDAFCRDQRIAPDWIVLDIEGFEVAALRGARETIAAGRGALGLVVEIHPALWPAAGTSRQAMESLLTELGLRAVPLAGQTDPLGEYGIVSLEPVASGG